MHFLGRSIHSINVVAVVVFVTAAAGAAAATAAVADITDVIVSCLYDLGIAGERGQGDREGGRRSSVMVVMLQGNAEIEKKGNDELVGAPTDRQEE